MKGIAIIMVFGLLVACNTQVKQKQSVEHVTIYDTVTIQQKHIDTVFVKKYKTMECTELAEEKAEKQSEFYIQERLPLWFLDTRMLNGLMLRAKGGYVFDNRINPLYLEEDFNGDGNLDIAIPIKQVESGKLGFAIVHGGTLDVHVIGAGVTVKNSETSQLGYVDIWMINREKSNSPGLNEETGTGPKGELLLKTPSLFLSKSESGGGLFYWDGEEYAYFHQSC